MTDQPLVAPLANGKSKDVRIVKVITETACCYREHRFEAYDVRTKCHLGLTKLDWTICPNCTWFGVRPPANTKVLTGGEAMAVMATLDTIKQTNDPATGERPADAEPIALDAQGG